MFKSAGSNRSKIPWSISHAVAANTGHAAAISVTIHSQLSTWRLHCAKELRGYKRRFIFGRFQVQTVVVFDACHSQQASEE